MGSSIFDSLNYDAIWPPIHPASNLGDGSIDAVPFHNPALAETPVCIAVNA
jgi:hypothetical protein